MMMPIHVSTNKPSGTWIFPPANYSCKPNIPISLVKSRLGRCAAVGDNEWKNEIVLPGGLQKQLMPKHVAVIMDGNRRWAKERGLPTHHGYDFGAKVMKQLAITCSKYGVKVFTAFALSTDNWARPKEDMDYFLQKVVGEGIIPDMDELMQKENMQVSYIGNKMRLPEYLQKKLCASEENGKTNTGMHFLFGLDYSGQYDIIEATKKIAKKVKDGVIQEDDVDSTLFEQHLITNRIPFPNPDLLIRTSGELRLSNFMLWQLAYTELYFCKKMFPDFDDTDFDEALTEFQQRKRRFGGHKY